MKRLIQRLNALPNRLLHAAASAAAATAQEACENARLLAPEDTGALRMSISSAQTDGGAAVYAAAPHAAMVEFGTGRMPPRPYMLPAAQSAAQLYFALTEKGIKHDQY